MPINRLGQKPPVLSTNSTAGASAITTNANFQGKCVSVAGQQQSESFLPAREKQRPSHIFSATNKYISVRNITTISEAQGDEESLPPGQDYGEQSAQEHDYDEISSLTYNDDEISLSMQGHEGLLSSSDNNNEVNPLDDIYVDEISPSMQDPEGLPSPSDDYDDISPLTYNDDELSPSMQDIEGLPSPSDDYDEMNPIKGAYVNVDPSRKDYQEVKLPPENLYREMRSFVDLPKTRRSKLNRSFVDLSKTRRSKLNRSFVDLSKTRQPKLNRSELIRMNQLGAECGNYMKEVSDDSQKITDCMKNLSALSKNDILALKDYVIPQHIKCLSDYGKALQFLLQLKKTKPDQRKYLQETNQQFDIIRVKLLEAQGVLRDAVQGENFSAQAASNYVDLKAEEKSSASQLMKVQSQVLDIHRVASDIRYRVSYLGGDSPLTVRRRGKEELVEIAACQRDLLALKTELSQCLPKIKQAMDTINHYEVQISEQPPAAGEQRTLRERRYTMHLANRLENRIKNINDMIADSWEKLKKMT